MRDFQLPGRSPVRATEGMVATSHPLSTFAALELLRSGGNAIDAAVCAAAVQAVVEPQSTGIGGDCFVLFAPEGTDDLVAFDGSGRAPAAATAQWYRDHGFEEIPRFGPHSVTIPGAVDAWCRLLADHGSMGIGAVLAPAIRYAEEGFVVHDRVAHDWSDTTAKLADDPHSARMLLRDGRAPRAGEVHRQPELAWALRQIATGGRAAFYEGEIAEDLVGRLGELGGLHTRADFAAASGRYVTPVSADYRSCRVHQLPPPNQASTALMMLGILSRFDLAALEPMGAERLHLELEAGRLAYQIRDRCIGDPDFAPVPVAGLVSESYAADLAALIDPGQARTDAPPSPVSDGDTVYISVVDRDRNVVSFINSLYHSFGSGLTGPRSGIVLQNRGASFRLDESHPNVVAPGKRPMHTIMPGLMTKNGRAVMPFGVMGGDYQPFGHTHVVTNMIDFGMDPQQAIDAPRVFHREGVVEAERGVSDAAREGLRARGHRLAEESPPHGGGQAIMIDWDEGTLTGGSDPRKDGCALGY